MPAERFLSVPEAGRLLGFSTRTIYKYVRNGVLTRKRMGGRLVVIEAEAQDLLIHGRDKANATKRTIRALSLRVARLEANLLLLNRILELQQDPLRLDDGELALIYKGCLTLLSHKTFTQEEARIWSDLLLRLDDRVLNRFGQITGDKIPTAKFYRLARRLLEALETTPGFKTNLSLQGTFDQIERARTILLGYLALEVERVDAETFSERIHPLLGKNKREELEQLAALIP